MWSASKFNKLSNKIDFTKFGNSWIPQIIELLQLLNKKQKIKREKDLKERKIKGQGARAKCDTVVLPRAVATERSRQPAPLDRPLATPSPGWIRRTPPSCSLFSPPFSLSLFPSLFFFSASTAISELTLAAGCRLHAPHANRLDRKVRLVVLYSLAESRPGVQRSAPINSKTACTFAGLRRRLPPSPAIPAVAEHTYGRG